MFKMSIKTNVLMIFLLLLSLVAFGLLFSQNYFSKNLAIEETHKTFNIISKNINKELEDQSTITYKILDAKSRDSEILEPITFDPFHPSLESLIEIFLLQENIHAIYFTHKNSDFYEVLNVENRSYLLERYKAPKLTTWIVFTIINHHEQIAFLDKNLQLISRKRYDKHFEPHIRPWYLQAIEANTMYSTMPYEFKDTHDMGISYSKELEDHEGVIAVDYTMQQLHSILASQKFNDNSEIIIANLEGLELVSSEEKSTSLSKMLDKELIQSLSNQQWNQVIQYTHDDKYYFAILQQLKNKKGVLAIRIDARSLLKPYNDSLRYAFLIAFILLLLSLPIIFLSINRIVKPIKALIVQNNKIKDRKFSEVKAIETNIIEFEALSTSLVSMSSSIQDYQKSQAELLDSIIKLIAEAIDAKSPYTGGHCKRVPVIAQLLLDAANKSTSDTFKTFALTSEDALREFEIGAWLHDCGKVTTPEYVVDKSTKLETIYNRIHEIRMRFEVLWRDAEIEFLNNKITKEALHVRHQNLQEDYAFVASSNVGGEFMDTEKQERIKAIANISWQRHFDDKLGLGEIEKLRYKDVKETLPVTEMLLCDKDHHIVKRENFDFEAYEAEGFKEEVPEHLYNYGEVYNLCIAKGTLSPEERYKINEHVIMSIKMLEKIPFPSQMDKIPEYAGTHHETLIGTGYPRKLSKEDLSIPARIMAIADIFEALTASDRPYKQAKTLSTSIKIMSFMVKDQHIDADLFKLFLSSGIYKIYAQKHLKPEQIDEVDISHYVEVL